MGSVLVGALGALALGVFFASERDTLRTGARGPGPGAALGSEARDTPEGVERPTPDRHAAGAQAATSVEAHADPTGRLRVRVVDALDGAPIRDARVRWSLGPSQTETITNATGEALFSRVPAQNSLQIALIDLHEAATLSSHATRARVEAGGTSEVVLRAVRDRRVQIHVLDVVGRPVADRVIDVARSEVPRLTTDARGRAAYAARLRDEIRIDGVKVLDVELEHLRTGSARVRAPDADGLAGATDAAGTVLIQGRVVRRTTGEGVSGARVTARRHERDPPLTATSGDEGAFALRAPEVRRSRFQVEAQHDVFGVASTVLGTDADAALLLQLDDAGAIEGRVTDVRGLPVPVFRARVGREGPGPGLTWIGTHTFVDPQGEFRFDDLVAGTYAVEVSTEENAPTLERSIEVPVAGRAIVAVELEEGGAVQGRVVDAETEAPIPGARVRLEGFGAASDTRTDPSGQFLLDDLAPGRRSLMVEADGYRRRLVSALEVRSGEALGPLDVRLNARAGDGEPELDMVGIGAILGGGSVDGLEVQRVVDGGGAAESGLSPGDVIVEIDGRRVSELGFDGSVQALRGREGTVVELRVQRSGSTRSVSVTRRAISV